MEELAELSQNVYFLCNMGLFRFNIPDFDRVGKFEFEIECVFYDPTNRLPYLAGLFSHRHYIYICGGEYAYKFDSRIYMFDPTKSHQLPIVEHDCLDKPEESLGNFESMTEPYVIQAEDQIYFLSRNDECPTTFRFQSFDPTKNTFETQPSPHPGKFDCNPFSPVCLFFVCGYLYLFIREKSSVRAFTFNTRSSEWKEREELLYGFDKKNIPIPHFHRGDIGLSDEFGDNSRILVALHDCVPTAYCVHLGADGSLSPKSYRVMDEVEVYFNYCSGSPSSQQGWSHLLDIGGDRFCLIYQDNEDVPLYSLLIFVFKIDFALEHAIQINEAKPPSRSSEILSSKRFRDPIPIFRSSTISAVCLAPAPSNSNQDPEKRRRETRVERKIGDNKALKRCSYS